MIMRTKESFYKNSACGFTLIELLIVFSVMAILSLIGISSFNTYSKNQALSTGVSEMANMLQIARSRAQSQIKPATMCLDTDTLIGYKVVLCGVTGAVCLGTYPAGPGSGTNTPLRRSYELQVRCGTNTRTVLSRTMPLHIRLNVVTSTQQFEFEVITGNVVGGSSSGTEIRIDGYSGYKSVYVYKDGRIRVQ